jgi:hypothetical protein
VSSRADRAARVALAGEFGRLVKGYCKLTIELEAGFDLDCAPDPNLNYADDLRIELNRAADLVLDSTAADELDRVISANRHRAFHLDRALRRCITPGTFLKTGLELGHAVNRLSDQAARLRIASMPTIATGRSSGEAAAEARILTCLSWLLPDRERMRFVGEAQGNLAACEYRTQRTAYLVGLIVGTPRLAWMMHRENRRGAA